MTNDSGSKSSDNEVLKAHNTNFPSDQTEERFRKVAVWILLVFMLVICLSVFYAFVQYSKADQFWVPILQFILENKEWLFSGIGIAVTSAITGLFLHKKKKIQKTQFTQLNDSHNINESNYKTDAKTIIKAHTITGGITLSETPSERIKSEITKNNISPDISSKEIEITDELKKVLVYLFDNINESQRHTEAIAKAFGIKTEKAKYFVDKLIQKNFVRQTHLNYVKGRVYFGLTKTGREYVVENDLTN